MTLVHSCAKSAVIPSQPEADDAAGFLDRVSAIPQQDIDLEYLAANILHGRGAIPKATKNDAVVAIRTLRAIVLDARRLAAITETKGTPQ